MIELLASAAAVIVVGFIVYAFLCFCEGRILP